MRGIVSNGRQAQARWQRALVDQAPDLGRARRGLRNTWRWPTEGSRQQTGLGSASPTACASLRSLPANPRARCAKSVW